ncbi:MAG: bifunctional oligoribonuclease/PAP phosphatase NrnA [Aquificae bacterium]|nr:bifunctional oligoribonuclease/PAP phosphatase NrnA [Aquificota bacterium]
MEMQPIPAVERLKAEQGKILLTTHENPDGDGIGSMLALYKFLKKKGKNVVCAMKDETPYIYNFLPNVNQIQKLPINKQFDLAVVVDAVGLHRVKAPVQAKEILRIDHHIGGEFNRFDYVDPTAPSTTYLVAKLLRSWEETQIDKDIATSLYTGLITDTGSFRYNNVDEKTFEMAKFLVKKGADPAYISTMIYERNKPNTLWLLTKTLSTLEIHYNGLIASLIVRRDFINETQTKEEDTEGFVNYARCIEGVEVAFIMIQKPDQKTWRVSLRGKGKIPVREIAQEFGGGGHKDAAGCRIQGEEAEVKNRLIQVSSKIIQKTIATKKHILV